MGYTGTPPPDAFQYLNNYVFNHYHIRIYDINGKIIEKYDGMYYIETYNTSQIVFIDTNNKRHMFCLKNGVAIVDEL